MAGHIGGSDRRRGQEGQAEIWWILAVEYLLDGGFGAGIIMPSVTGRTVR